MDIYDQFMITIGGVICCSRKAKNHGRGLSDNDKWQDKYFTPILQDELAF
jgi:hypothetical protein